MRVFLITFEDREGQVVLVYESERGSRDGLDDKLSTEKQYRLAVLPRCSVDLQTANALTELALELRVGLAMVGATYQALPVGHAGAMGSAIRRATARVELDTVHRSRDPEYAALTLRLRDVGESADAVRVAGDLAERGHLERADHTMPLVSD